MGFGGLASGRPSPFDLLRPSAIGRQPPCLRCCRKRWQGFVPTLKAALTQAMVGDAQIIAPPSRTLARPTLQPL